MQRCVKQRIIFGGFFIFSGINHFTSLEETPGYAKSKGVPLPSVAVPIKLNVVRLAIGL